ncbi:MAG: universal stress protein [Spirochaetes bacterium]|nr:universal stress protein [Spirochaetota bacterium]
MFDRILVPLDGSASAETALASAEALRAVFDSTVTLIHLPEADGPKEVHGQRHFAGGREAGDYLDEVAGRAFPPGAKIERHVHEAEVTDLSKSLAEHAVELYQDLVILCVHGSGGLERLFEGSLGQRIMRYQTSPVLILRAQNPPVLPFRRILLALDGKPEHEQSFALVRDFAAATGAAVDLVSVIPTRSTLKGGQRAVGLLSPSAMRESLRLSEATIDAYLGEKAEQLAAAGIAADVIRRSGDPARQIARLARERASDLIVLGTHGRAGTRAFWAESAAARIIAAVRLPALLVPSERGS